MIVAFTGHRPHKLGGYGADVFARLVRLAETYMVETGVRFAISGLALGWDQAVAQAALNTGRPFIAAVPFVGQESRWPEASQRAYRALLAQATSVEIVCPGGYSPRAMQIRNEWMVDHSGRLGALWDGSVGGTANCVNYAIRQNRPYDNLWPWWVA